jgi:hypothetical protein
MPLASERLGGDTRGWSAAGSAGRSGRQAACVALGLLAVIAIGTMTVHAGWARGARPSVSAASHHANTMHSHGRRLSPVIAILSSKDGQDGRSLVGVSTGPVAGRRQVSLTLLGTARVTAERVDSRAVRLPGGRAPPTPAI